MRTSYFSVCSLMDIYVHEVFFVLSEQLLDNRETPVRAFPAPDLRRKTVYFLVNPCVSAGDSKEMMN